MPLDLLRQTVIRWSDPDPRHVPLLRDGGVTTVLIAPDETFEKACAAAGIQVAHESEVQFVTVEDAAKAKPGSPVIFRSGLWPGVHTPTETVASATRGVWIDQNCYLIEYLRALFPKLPPVLGYLPDKEGGVPPERSVPFDTLEMAMAEAWMPGGNFVLALEARFREELLKGSANAVTAWRGVGRMAHWLRDNPAVFGRPMQRNVTILVENKTDSLEIANLAFRQNVSPALLPAANPPAPDPARCLELVAVGIDPPDPQRRRLILANAQAGTTLVVDAAGEQAWWRVAGLKQLREDAERVYYSLGKGQIVAYKDPVVDPSDLALDLLDYTTQKRRAARVFNCNAAVVMAGDAVLYIVNYGRPQDLPVLARIQGAFTKATFLRPGAPPEPVKVSRRGSSSEATLPRLERVAAVVFG
jgi:hypothetical protein